MRITAWEQGSLELVLDAGGSPEAVDVSDATTVVEAGKEMGVRFASWDSPRRLRFHQFIGLLVTGHHQVEVLPKVEGWTGPDEARQCLLHMLAKAHDLDLRTSEQAACTGFDEPVMASLARIYYVKLAEALRRGLPQNYQSQEERLTAMRGKLHWPDQIRLNLTHVPEFACRFDERSLDTPLNRLLKAALRRAESLIPGDLPGSLGLELRHALEGIATVTLSPLEVASIRLDRMSRHLEPLVTLAKLLLGAANPDFRDSRASSGRTFALVWDMNTLFESYIAKVIRSAFEELGHRVFLQGEASQFLGVSSATGHGAFLLRPDVLIEGVGGCRIVVDTKWKRLDPDEPHLSVSSADVYQVLAYSQSYQAPIVALVYPHATNLGMPGLKHNYTVKTEQGPIQIRVITVDLSELDTMEVQVAKALTSIAYQSID